MAGPALNRGRWAQLGLAGLAALAAGWGFTRAFSGTDVRSVVVVAALVPVALAAAARLVGWTRWLAAAHVVAFVVLAGVVVFPSGGPLPISDLLDGLVNGWSRAISSAVPMPERPELLVVPYTVVWLTATAAAELTLRTRAPMAPALAVVAGIVATEVVTGGVAFDDAAAVGVVVALLALLVLSRTEASRRFGRTLLRRRPVDGPTELPVASRRRQVLLAVPVVAVLAVAVPLAASALPGTPDTAFDPRDDQPPPVLEQPLVSPLAFVAAQVQERPPRLLFHVDAAEAASWRLVVLDRYDGVTWGSSEPYELAGDDLPDPPTTGDAHALDQTVTVVDLPGPWLPAADHPVAADLGEVAVQPSTGALADSTGSPVLPARYGVTSLVPDYDPEALAAASVSADAVLADARALPDGFPAAVAELADETVAGLATDYGRLRALQTTLRDGGGFVVGEDAPPGHSYGQVNEFLGRGDPDGDEPAAGSAEQFATLYALMARYLGYPARLAVGYRTGAPTEGGFDVTTADAHVWPEVALEGLGWVPFDPTPAQARQAAADAGLEEARAAADDRDPPPPDQDPDDAPGDEAVAAGDDDGGRSWLAVVAGTLAVVAVAAAAALVAVVAVKAARSRRRRRAGSARARVLGAWDEVVDRLRDAGLAVGPQMAPAEVATATGAAGWTAAAPAVADLGRLANRARYSRRAVPEGLARQAWSDRDTAVGSLARGAGPWRRVRRRLSLRAIRRPRP